MKPFLLELKTSVLLTAVFIVLLGGAYPLAVWAGAQALFPAQANGSLITDGNGTVLGSALLAQSFTSARYFQSRPSAAGTGYDAANSGGTNLGPTSRKLANDIQAAIIAYRVANDLAADRSVPADAVTCSASGLDPEISIANAALQAPRVARVRHLPLAAVRLLVGKYTEERDFGVLGEPGVNVLRLNLALDRLAPVNQAMLEPNVARKCTLN